MSHLAAHLATAPALIGREPRDRARGSRVHQARPAAPAPDRRTSSRHLRPSPGRDGTAREGAITKRFALLPFSQSLAPKGSGHASANACSPWLPTSSTADSAGKPTSATRRALLHQL